MNQHPSLRFAIYDGIAWALMIGLAEAFFSAYAIFLAATPAQIAILAAYPTIIPAIAQLTGVKLMSYYSSRKALCVRATVMHALGLLPIALIGVVFYSEQGYAANGHAARFLLLFAAIYFFFGALGNPAWNSLIGDLVPANSRGAFFSLRNKKISYASFTALIMAGPTLAYFHHINLEAWGYLVIFMTALVARLVSGYWLSHYEDPELKKSDSDYFSFYDFIRRTPHSNFAKFAWYVCLMLAAQFICGPFFSVYLLRELQLSYTEFTCLSASLILAQVLTLSHWGKLSDSLGNKIILFAASVGICLAPVIWTFSTNFYYLIFVHMYSGFVWSGFNLAAANFLFDAVTPAKRARCAAYQSVMNGFFCLCGALLGGYLMSHPIPEFTAFFAEAGDRAKYFFIMYLSAAIRVAIILVFWKKIMEVREVENVSGKELVFKIINIRAISGISFGFDSRTRK